MEGISLVLSVVLGIVFMIAGAHILITKIFPKVKDVLLSSIKNEKTVGAIMTLFLIYTGVFVLKKAIELLVSIGNEYVSMIAFIVPGLDLLLNLLPYVGGAVLGALIAFRK